MKAVLQFLLILGLSNLVHAQPGQWQLTLNNNWGYTVVDVPAAVEIPEISGGDGHSAAWFWQLPSSTPGSRALVPRISG